MNSYVEGNIVVIQDTLLKDDRPVAASEATLNVKDPNGTVRSYTGGEIANPSVGVYTYNLDTTNGAAGIWTYQWVTTGSGQAVTDPEDFRLSARLS